MLYSDHISKVSIENGYFNFVERFPNFSEYFIWGVNENEILLLGLLGEKATKILQLKDYWDYYVNC
jgi:hypothetical protein